MVIHYRTARARENFPVASWLFPRQARPVILALYDFARGADNIADSQSLTSEEKREQLGVLAAALRGEGGEVSPWARAYLAAVQRAETSAQHGLDLLHAFTQDATKLRYAGLEELAEYCRYSAAPVGRAVLEACGETQPEIAASDALCGALQLTNHAQDLQKDYRELNRIYLPLPAEEEAGLDAAQLSPALRARLNEMLALSEQWVEESAHFPATLRSKRLRVEIAFIWQIARRLNAKLRTQDPLAQRVKLSPLDYTACFIRAISALWMHGNKP